MSITPPVPPSESPKKVDVLIVGGGPAGATAALVLGRQQRRVLLVDEDAPRNATAEHLHMYLTRDGEDPAEFRARGRDEIARHPGVEVQAASVESLTIGDDGLAEALIRPSGGERAPAPVLASAVLLATGVRDRVDHLPGLAERWGTDVVHCAYCHGFEALDRSVVVVSHAPADAMLAAYLADRFSGDVVLVVPDHDVPPPFLERALRAGVRVERTATRSIEGTSGAPVVVLDDGRRLPTDVVFHPTSDLRVGDRHHPRL